MGLLELLIVIILIMWITGQALAVGPLIHLLLIVLIVVVIIRVLQGQRL